MRARVEKVDVLGWNKSDPLCRGSPNLEHKKWFGHPVYSLDGPGRSVAVSGPHEDFSAALLGYG